MRLRQEILEDLIKYQKDLASLKAELSQYPYDWFEEEAPVRHTRQDILNVLNRYLSGELSALQLNEWADSIASREDIDNENGYNKLINDVLQNIDRDTLIEPFITREEVIKLAEELKNTPFDPNGD